MSTYSFARSSFASGLDEGQLHLAIAAAITDATLLGVFGEPDTVDVAFAASLSAGDITLLNTVVAAHVPVVQTPYSHVAHATIRRAICDNAVYTLCAVMTTPGEAVARLQALRLNTRWTNILSADFRFYDATHNKVLGTASYSSTGEAVRLLAISGLANLPAALAELELHVRCTFTASASNPSPHVELLEVVAEYA